MPLKVLNSLGSRGVVTDVDPYTNPDGTWTHSRGLRFKEGYVGTIAWHEDLSIGLTHPAAFLLPFKNGIRYNWVIAGYNAISSWDGTLLTDVSRAGGYSAVKLVPWQGDVFQGIPILNNTTDAPQAWNVIAGAAEFADLPWDATNTWTQEGATCQVIKGFGPFLVALSPKLSGIHYEHSILWSHPADPGTLPVSWDYTDPTKLAGLYPLPAKGGPLTDALRLRDKLIIYKEDSVHALSIVGGSKVMDEITLFKHFGAVARNCVVDVGGRHVVLHRGDVFIHDGNSSESIVDARVKRLIFNAIDVERIEQSFLYYNRIHEEVWVCTPTTGNDKPNVAAIWSVRDNTWTSSDLPFETHHAAVGVDIREQDPAVPWSAFVDIAWSEMVDRAWVERPYNPNVQTAMSGNGTTISVLDSKQPPPDTSQSQVEGVYEGIMCVSENAAVFVNEAWIQASGGRFSIRFGAKDAPDDSVNWERWLTFEPGRFNMLPIRVRGSQISFAIKADQKETWKLNGMTLNFSVDGV